MALWAWAVENIVLCALKAQQLFPLVIPGIVMKLYNTFPLVTDKHSEAIMKLHYSQIQ